MKYIVYVPPSSKINFRPPWKAWLIRKCHLLGPRQNGFGICLYKRKYYGQILGYARPLILWLASK